MTPPLATAATTAAEVQLAGVPLPTVLVGFEVSAARAAAGTAACPSGLPACAAEAAFGAVVAGDGSGRRVLDTVAGAEGAALAAAVVTDADAAGAPA
ncbi:hypothetical protein [Streptomyces sp. NBC_01477]|uniref:hypothetical protein n=1 Tax=Streptomyces sp. NBC_01477 TaxID=2976015 RepID=UPI002E37A4C0|nr:hypothetical protein [Streptomyces sp. NBC_01477]